MFSFIQYIQNVFKHVISVKINEPFYLFFCILSLINPLCVLAHLTLH